MSKEPEGKLRIEYVPLASLVRTQGNPKDHELGAIHQSMNRFGYTSPMLVNETSGNLVAGHGRLDVLQQKKASGEKPPQHVLEEKGEWMVPVIRGLSFANDDEARAYIIADNRLVELGGWKDDLLVPWLADLATKPGGLDGIGYDGDDLDRMMRELQASAAAAASGPDPKIEKAAELQKKWGTAKGQIWQAGPHRIACGDCRDAKLVAALFAGDKARMIWTDPPYGVSYGEKTAWMQSHGAQRERKVIENDSLKPEELQKLFADCLKVAIPHMRAGAAVYATVPSLYLKYFIQGMEDGGVAYHHCLVWVKQSLVMGRSDYHYRHEPIIYGWIENGPHYFSPDRTQDSVFEVDRPSVSDLHPTTKPTELAARMINNSSQPGDTVYDSFMGSGTVAVAAHQLERHSRGTEAEPGYVAVCLERLAEMGLKPELIEGELAPDAAPNGGEPMDGQEATTEAATGVHTREN